MTKDYLCALLQYCCSCYPELGAQTRV